MKELNKDNKEKKVSILEKGKFKEKFIKFFNLE